jgi:hypothetical protein
MSVNKTQGPTADDYKAALDSLFAPPGSTDTKSSDLDLLPGGATKSQGPQTSFKDLASASDKSSAPGASGQIVMKEGVGVTTANPQFNRSPGARAAQAHGGLLSMSSTGRTHWTGKLHDPSSIGQPFDRKGFAHVSLDKEPSAAQTNAIHVPLLDMQDMTAGARPKPPEFNIFHGAKTLVDPNKYILSGADIRDARGKPIDFKDI